MPRRAGLGVAWLVLTLLTGCAVAETVIEPRASGVMQIAPAVPTAQVFDCAQDSIASAARSGRHWGERVTHIDSTRGVIEFGNYAESNRIGVRVRMLHVRDASLVFLRVKAGGPYYVDLGAERAVLELQARMRECLTAGAPVTAKLGNPTPPNGR